MEDEEVIDVPLIIPKKKQVSGDIPLIIPSKKKENTQPLSTQGSKTTVSPLKSGGQSDQDFSPVNALLGGKKPEEQLGALGLPNTPVEEVKTGMQWDRPTKVVGHVEGSAEGQESPAITKLQNIYQALDVIPNPYGDLGKFADKAFINSAIGTLDGMNQLGEVDPSDPVAIVQYPVKAAHTAFAAAGTILPPVMAFNTAIEGVSEVLPQEYISALFSPMREMVNNKVFIIPTPNGAPAIIPVKSVGKWGESLADAGDLVYQGLTAKGLHSVATKVKTNQPLTVEDRNAMAPVIDEVVTKNKADFSAETLSKIPESVPTEKKIEVAPLVEEKTNLENKKSELESSKQNLDDSFHAAIDKEVKATEKLIEGIKKDISDSIKQEGLKVREEKGLPLAEAAKEKEESTIFSDIPKDISKEEKLKQSQQENSGAVIDTPRPDFDLRRRKAGERMSDEIAALNIKPFGKSEKLLSDTNTDLKGILGVYEKYRNEIKKINEEEAKLNPETKTETDAVQIEKPTESVLRDEGVRGEGELQGVVERNEPEVIAQESVKEEVVTTTEQIKEESTSRSAPSSELKLQNSIVQENGVHKTKDIDLKGNKKELWMMTFDETINRLTDVAYSLSEKPKEDIQKFRKNQSESQGNIDFYKKQTSNAIKENAYQKAISEGRMTANDAKLIVESAGLEVPKDILELAKKSTPKEEVVEPLKDVVIEPEIISPKIETNGNKEKGTDSTTQKAEEVIPSEQGGEKVVAPTSETIPPKPPKATPPKEELGSLPPREKELAVIKRIRNSEKIKDKQEVESLLKTKGKYKVSNRGESRKLAKQVVDEFGMEEALNQAREEKYGGAVSSAMFAEVLDRKHSALEKATGEAKEKLAEEWADLAYEYAIEANEKGKFNSQIHEFYQNSPLGVVKYAEKIFDNRKEEILAKSESNAKEAYQDLIDEFPFLKKEVEGLVTEARESEAGKSFKEKSKTIADKVRKLKGKPLKFKDKDGNEVTVNTSSFYDEAIEITAKIIEATGDVLDAVSKGIERIKQEDFYKKLTPSEKKSLEENFADNFSDIMPEVKKKIKEADKEKILNKWRKKLKKLSDEDRSTLLNKALVELTDKGFLEYEDFRNLYAKALGIPELTKEARVKLEELATDIKKVDSLKEELDATDSPTDKQLNDFIKARDKSARASTDLNALIGKSKSPFDLALTIARLNTLSPKSLLGNPIFNLAVAPIKFAEKLIGTGLDYVLPEMKNQELPKGTINVLKTQAASAKGLVEGAKKSVKQLLTGMTDRDYFEKEIRQNIKPLAVWRELNKWWKGEKKLQREQVIANIIEGTAGITAEVNARLLGMGDKPFRYMTEYPLAEQIGKAKGYTGNKLKAFMLSPDEVSAELIRKAGEESVMVQENFVTGILDRIGNSIKAYGAEKKGGVNVASKAVRAAGTLTQPFLRTPLNAALLTMELSLPEYSLARAIYHTAKGERDAAIKYYSRAVAGAALYAVANKLVSEGLVMPEDKDKRKDRNIIEEYYSGGSLNFSGLKRMIAGGDTGYQDGDLLVSLYYFGIPGAVMKMNASLDAKMKYDQIERMGYIDQLGFRVSNAFVDGIKSNVFGSTSTLLNAMNMGGSYVNSWLIGVGNVAANFVEPAWVTNFSKALPATKANLASGGFMDELSHNINNRTFGLLGDRSTKITMWGQEAKNTPHDTYMGRMLFNNLDITNGERVDTDQFGYKLAVKYLETRNKDLFPSQPQDKFTYDKKAVQLEPEQYEQFQVLVGTQRKSLVEPFITGAAKMEITTDGKKKKLFFSEMNNEEQITALNKLYDEGYDTGKEMFVALHPEMFPETKKKSTSIAVPIK